MPEEKQQTTDTPKRPKKNAGGRPSKYKPEYCQQIEAFFDVKPYYDKELPHYGKEGELKWVDYKRMANPLPTLIKFARSIKVNYSTVYRWQNEKDGAFQPEFKEAYARAKDLQKEFLIENGLNDCYNAGFAKFVAINITDMTDTPLVDNTKHLHITYGHRRKKTNDAGPVRGSGRPGLST